jgi:tellurite resistance protein TehA-like permease
VSKRQQLVHALILWWSQGCSFTLSFLCVFFRFLFEGVFSAGVFSVIFYMSILGLSALNVSQIKTPKLSGNSVNVRTTRKTIGIKITEANSTSRKYEKCPK